MTITITGNFLKDTREFFERMPGIADEAAMMAINQVSNRVAVPMFIREMNSQIEFPQGYLNRPDRFGVSQPARRGNLKAVISGRDRATSLARFAPSQTPASTRKGGVTVRVSRGQSTHMDKSFLVNLRSGNIGLAVRLKPGNSIHNTKGAVKVKAWSSSKGDVYLLYGPSVDQVFRGTIVSGLPTIDTALSKEFYRQVARLSRRG